MNLTSLLAGTGALHGLLIGLALAGMVLAILIWVMEFAGWTISRRGFIRSQVSWDATTIALIAVVAAIYIAGRPLQLQFIPGIGGVNPSMSLAPVFAVLFGLPGAIGVTFSMPIGDAVSGALTVGSAAGFLSHTFITWLPYKLVREPNFKVRSAVASFYLWAIVVGPLIHTIVIPGWLDFTNGLPSAVAWGALPIVLLVNHTITPAIIAPMLITILYPVVKARGLYWRDRIPHVWTDAGEAPSIGTGAGILSVSALRFRYPTGQQDALGGVSFTVRRGEFIGITGPSGAGKTTLALCLRGLIPHSVAGSMSGQVIVCGLNTRHVKPAATGEKVGLVFQDPEAQIIGLTVAEDLAFGPENYKWPPAWIRAEIPALLQLVRLDGMQDHATFSLSGGQKQRVALAGALMMKPDLLILDEPTSELDPVGKVEVFDAVQRLREQHNTTIVMIEHDVEQLAGFADQILMIDGGRVIAQGTPRELFRNVDLFHRTGGERLPQVAELMYSLEQDGLITSDQYTPYENEATEIISGLLGPEASPITVPRSLEPTGGGAPPIIEVRDVFYQYDASRAPVLNGVSLSIARGEFVALIGPNGAGKTTLAKTFNGMLTPTDGQVFLDGRESRSAGIDVLASIVGYVYQNPDHQIFARTVKEEVAFGPRHLGMPALEIDRAVNEALALVGMQDDAETDPFLLGRGKRQKLAVASVIAIGSPVLVVDEPTTGLDLQGSLSILHLLRQWNAAGRTVVIITHDMSVVAEFARRTVVVAEGRILADGPTRQVLTDQALLARACIKAPQITRLAQNLDARLGFPRDILTVDDFRAALRQQLGVKAAR